MSSEIVFFRFIRFTPAPSLFRTLVMILFFQQYCDFTLILNMLTYQSEKMIQTKSQNLAIFYGYSCFVYILQLTNLQTYKLTRTAQNIKKRISHIFHTVNCYM